jgi:hypothetical protein
MTISQTISAIPTPPSRSDPANFDARADAFLGALPDLATEVNTWAGQANALASTVNGDLADAEAAADAAETAQGLTEDARDTATTQAGIATSAALTATTQANSASASAVSAAASAVTAQGAAASAVAVVTGGTASLTPAAGKIPLAGADGRIDAAWLRVNANDIGTPGQQGFGVGICPDLPAGFSLLSGTTDPASANYGNYQYQDGSIMVWIPAIWVKYAAGEPDDVKPLAYFVDEATANAAGYASHRADWDGGEHKAGFFVDKYLCSEGEYDGSPVASSLALGVPLVSGPAASGQVGFAAVGATNAYHGAIVAAKTRGASFFCSSRAIFAKLALLSFIHGKRATATTYCAWYDGAGTTNFPKGCNGNNLKDTNDATVTFTSAAPAGTYPNAPLTGSGSPFAKTTHNGQACGVTDLNGAYWEINLGMTCVASAKTITGATQANPVAITAVAHGFSNGDIVMITGVNGMTQIKDKLFKITKSTDDVFTLDDCDGSGFSAYTSGGTATKGSFYATTTATAMKDYTSGTTLATDHWGATGIAATMAALTPDFRLDYANNGFAQKFGGSGATWSGALSGDDWHRDGLGLPQTTGISAAGTNAYGVDYFYQYVRDAVCLISGGAWDNTSNAGVWALALSYYRTNAHGTVGFRAATYG